MKVHVLGRYAGYPAPGGGCAGYLVEAGGRRLLLDCGPGTLGRLQTHCAIEDLDAVLLTHMHADHCLDLVPMAYALMAWCQTHEAGRKVHRVPLFVPAGTRGALAALSRALGHPLFNFQPVPGASPAYEALVAGEKDFLFNLLPCEEYALDGEVSPAGIPCRTRTVQHGVIAAGVRVEHEGVSLVYSGDTRFTPALVELARGADLLLCEATTTPDTEAFYVNHMSPAAAGRVAREAGARRLVLVHVPPGADEEGLLAIAGEAFGGPVAVAHEGETYDVEGVADGRG